jgi:hypothetical protein
VPVIDKYLGQNFEGHEARGDFKELVVSESDASS